MRLAITGGTGFVGSHLLDRALAAGLQVRALTRRPQPSRAGLAWVEGALDDPGALGRLVQGCDAVIHVAGVINGDPEAFRIGNVAGTEAMVGAAADAGIGRFVHVSSLAAREPGLSAYGHSKACAEEAVIAAGGDWTIVRPPAIYGPRDRELLELFRIARRGVVPLPSRGRLSVIAVGDLCDLLLACVARPIGIAHSYEPDDGRDGGWDMPEFARAIGRAVGRRVLPLPIPQAALRLGARADGLIRRGQAKLTPDRVAYFCHPDWVAAPHARPPDELWRPATPTEAGLADTARWYRAEGWL